MCTCVMDADLDLLTRIKGCHVWEFPREATCLCCTLQCSVKIPQLEMSSKLVQQHSWSLFSFISGALEFLQCLIQANQSVFT